MGDLFCLRKKFALTVGETPTLLERRCRLLYFPGLHP
jgi:hypothetical protein